MAGSGHSFSAAVPTDGTLLRLDRLSRILDADSAQAARAWRRGSRSARSTPACRSAAWRCPTSATSTRRRSPERWPPARTARARACRTSPPRSSRWSWCSATARTASSPTATCCGRRASGSARWAPSPPSRCAACPRSGCAASTARSRSRRSLDSLDERVAAHDHFEFWTFPHSPLALTRTNDRTDEPVRAPGRPRPWVHDILLDNHALLVLMRAARRFPRAIPAINRFASRAASGRERVDWSHRIFASPRLVRFDEMEYAIPREHAAEAVSGVPRDPRAPPRLVPGRAALRGRRRRPALTRARARHRLRRRARVRGDGRRGAVPRGREADGAAGAGARTGASAPSSARAS